ncbi:MAG TPA: hypothetical protein VNV82_25830 [Bryobacteraceae bacterium]|nr:hypothetical protein [Bryobacteraceae bacterium]
MKTILSSFLTLTLLVGASSLAFAKTSGSSSKKGNRGKSRSGSQRNPGRQKTNIPKNKN